MVAIGAMYSRFASDDYASLEATVAAKRNRNRKMAFVSLTVLGLPSVFALVLLVLNIVESHSVNLPVGYQISCLWIPVPQLVCTLLGVLAIVKQQHLLVVPVLVYTALLYLLFFYCLFLFGYYIVFELFVQHARIQMPGIAYCVLLMVVSGVLAAWSAAAATTFWKLRQDMYDESKERASRAI